MAARDRVRGVGAHRIVQADETEVLEVEVVLLAREPFGRGESGPCDGEDPLTGVGRGLDLSIDRSPLGGRTMAEIGNRFGGALGGHDVVRPMRRSPHVRERQEVLGQRVFADEVPPSMEVFGAGQRPFAELPKGTVHRVEGVQR